MTVAFYSFYTSLGVLVVLFLQYGIEQWMGRTIFSKIDPYLRSIVRRLSYWTLKVSSFVKKGFLHVVFEKSKELPALVRSRYSKFLEKLKGSDRQIERLYEPASSYLKQVGEGAVVDNDQSEQI